MSESADGRDLPASDALHCAKALMPNLILLALAVSNLVWIPQTSGTSASLRGLRVVSPQVVWASGTKGTFLRTVDGGEHWQAGIVPGAEELDFRDVEASDGKTAYLLASGEGDHSRVFKTVDGGSTWELLLTNPDAKGFFDALAFWDEQHAILLGDPVDGEFVIYTTGDAGKTWQRHMAPKATPDEGAFAASGTALVTQGKKDAWFATGGPQGGRVFHTRDGGRTWAAASTGLGGVKTAGVFSLAWRDSRHGVAVGGDYQKPDAGEKTASTTDNSGGTWHNAPGLEYHSGVTPVGKLGTWIAVGSKGSTVSKDDGRTWQHFSDLNLNAVASTNGAVFAVGPKGTVVKLKGQP